jgi:unsaturated chondroitin disaccharide hydrolase
MLKFKEISRMLQEKDKIWRDGVISKITDKMDWVSEKSKDKIPYTTINGTHDDNSIHENQNEGNQNPLFHGNLNWWTNGFWGGMLWLMFRESKIESYAKAARVLEEKLARCLEEFYGVDHDLGFMWLLTAVADYRITGNPESRRRGLHAANLLAGRFNPVGKFIRAWNDNEHVDNKGWAIIDCMMNLPLLYWATKETGDPRFEQIAVLHADTVMDNFVRADGSCEHIVEFDPIHGGVVKTYGGQGYAEGSSWTRGQSWALYGFIISYLRTHKPEYLNTAKRIAEYFISNIPENGFIPIDFRQPEEPQLEDSTAAAIAACGLIEIARNVQEYERDIYLNAAMKLLKALEESRSNWTKDCDCILENCSVAYHSNGHHINIIYGDYFFMEAVFKLKGNDIFFW